MRLGVLLEPLDVLFFRDGRPFGPATRAGGALPNPQTLCGALTTALLQHYGCSFDDLAKRVKSGADVAEAVTAACPRAPWVGGISVRGPWLARIPVDRGAAAEVLMPAPANLHQEKDASRRGAPFPLRPLTSKLMCPAVGGAAPGRRPLWSFSRSPTEQAHGFLTRNGAAAVLRSAALADPADLLHKTQLYEHDHRTGVAIDADRLAAADGQIYGVQFVALGRQARFTPDGSRYDVAFFAEIDLPDEAPRGHFEALETMSFGGEGRRVALTWLPPDSRPTRPPANPPSTAGDKPFLWLTTPGLFKSGWYPACLAGLVVGAAVPAPLALSGWDLAHGRPKPTRFAAPAGSVYFLDRLPDGWRPDHLPHSVADDPADQRLGYGCFLTGTWTDD